LIDDHHQEGIILGSMSVYFVMGRITREYLIKLRIDKVVAWTRWFKDDEV
jgi:hypothetical protein